MIIETINAFGDKIKHEDVKRMFITQYGINLDSKYTDGIIERILTDENDKLLILNGFDEDIRLFTIKDLSIESILITPEYFVITRKERNKIIEKTYNGTIIKCFT